MRLEKERAASRHPPCQWPRCVPSPKFVVRGFVGFFDFLPSPRLRPGLECRMQLLDALPCRLETYLDRLGAPPCPLFRLSVFRLKACQTARCVRSEHLQP